jgi:TetR/AcrR family transcriptional regulator, transcriptional repressor for nem operon
LFQIFIQARREGTRFENVNGQNDTTNSIAIDFYSGDTYKLVGMLRDPEKRKFRDPERTRERLLQAGFQEVYRSGFQSASVDTILAAANVTKGALYYHFESKEALGHAIIDEVVATFLRNRWLLPLQHSEDKDSIDVLIGVVQSIPARPRDVKGGCPLVNLAQEMSRLDELFRRRLEVMFRAWREAVATALRRGQSQGTVRRDLIPEETASFLIAMVEGYEVLAKNAQDVKLWNEGIRNIVGWLQSLRAPRQPAESGRRMSKKSVASQRRRIRVRRKR